jgi:hypothetical protein
MKKLARQPVATAADPAAVESLLADPGSAAKASPEVATAAVEAAQARVKPDVLWALANHPVRAVGKSARRALHLLRSRGVEVGERPLPHPVKVGTPEHEPELELCRASAIDGFGDRALWVPLRLPHGIELWQAIISDEAGIREVQRVELSRRQLRQHFDAVSREDVAIGDVSRARASALLAESIALGADARVAAEARDLLGRLGPADPALAKPVSMGAPPLPAVEESARLAESAALFGERALQSFVPAEASLRELAAKLDEVDVSPLALDARQKAERRRRTVDDAIEAYFTPARRARLARRLFELVDLWTNERRALPAAQAAAAARHLAGGSPALGNPFARAMFERVFAREASPPVPREEPPAPGGLILPPG